MFSALDETGPPQVNNRAAPPTVLPRDVIQFRKQNGSVSNSFNPLKTVLFTRNYVSNPYVARQLADLEGVLEQKG